MKAVATAETTMTAAPAHPATAGMPISEKTPGAQLLPIMCCTALSSPSLAAAKQQTSNPKNAKNKTRIPMNGPPLCAG